ncbi:hypothetical protein KKI24_16480 [bacterium]|nr:hypothetical protein [bacterium]
MKTRHLFFLFTLLFPLLAPFDLAGQQPDGSAVTHFQWVPGSEETPGLLGTDDGFRFQQGHFVITGPPVLKQTGEELLRFLSDSEQTLAGRYHLTPGTRQYFIPLIPAASLKGHDYRFPILSNNQSQMVFPFAVTADARLEDPVNRFAVFNLLQVIIKANLAYGDSKRLPVSSHAFRFIDGLSGYLALEIMLAGNPAETRSYLDILENEHRKREIARRFSATQLLAQNSNSEDTDILAGLNQFLSGIGLTRDSEKAINLPDSSSTADRIRIFQWIETNIGPGTVTEIIQYLSRSTDIWTIDENAEDSFCRETIGFGCREKTIDGTRADIILQYTTGMNFAQLLKQSRQRPAGEFVPTGPSPQYPVYGFDFPKAGGANENMINLYYLHDRVAIDTSGIIDAETIIMNGASLALGIRDEAYQVQVQVDYTSGRKKQDERLMIANIRETVPQTIVSTDLQIGSRVIKSGTHSGWVEEIGVFFHWKRLQVEWDTRRLAGRKTDTEYVNYGFFLLDVQNTRAKMVTRHIAIGLNYDFQLGLVNQSGSTLLARDEKYNTDTSNLVLGINLGPELRLSIPSLLLDIRLGGAADFLWQPMDDQGGRKDGENDINASQSRMHLYASVGIHF